MVVSKGDVLERKELHYLKTWHGTKSRKPLVIRGARQVGKSTLVRQFAREKGLHLLELNFERNPEYKDAFTSNNPTRILATLQILTGEEIDVDKGLLFLDEIQVAPEALLALRYFYEEMPKLAILAAGSLLEFTLSDAKFSMPVGRIEYMHLGPMCFSDFLLAMGEQPLLEYLSGVSPKDITHEGIPKSVHEKAMVLYRQFCVVGGMPEAVSRYASSRSYAEALKAQHSVLATYRDDFHKYSQRALTQRVQRVFDRAPALVGKKFKYVHVSKEDRAAELREALDQLCLARVLYRVHHSAANGIPLGAEQKDTVFKLLFMDVGLMCSVLHINEMSLQGETPDLVNKGAVSEQFVGQHLLYEHSYYEAPGLFYWVREAKSSSAEVDYLMAIGQHVLPVEIKAGSTGSLRSLHQFCHEKHQHYALRFNSEPPSWTKNASAKTYQGKVSYDLLSLPFYMVGEVRRLAGDFFSI